MSDKLTIKEIQQEEKEMLKSIVTYMEENNLDYTIAYGTLLGAIRHKGFIPWDDDIDILMPRPSYEKFVNMYKGNSDLYLGSYEKGNLYLPFCKIFNKKIKIQQYDIKKTNNDYLWIDVFPLDGLPESEVETKTLFRKKAFYKKCLGLSNTKVFSIFKEWKKPYKFFKKLLMKPIVSIIPQSFFVNKLNELREKYDYNTSNYVGNVVWGIKYNEKIKKDIFKDFEKIQFEDISVYGIKNYDYYLSKMYGDYMKLPPENKRYTHSFDAYRNEIK